MSKFLYTFLFLAVSFFTSSNHAMDDSGGWLVDTEYEHKGTIFPKAVCTYTKEKNESTGFIRHSPKNPVTLTPATIEFMSPDAILHDKYYEKQTALVAVQSFTVTPNPTGLTKDSEDLSSLPIESYGSIPIKLSAITKNLELLIFSNGTAAERKDYGKTMAGALEIILSQYIPVTTRTGHFSGLETVIITDSAAPIATTLLEKATRGIPSFALQSYLPIQPGINHYWKMVFKTSD